ncbi:MAG: hypothetical protein ISR65_10560 [Bacteriovoracaceae bacterium]|nr:hypothetical protein [Bacteriovoracaceae bacterium]
MNQEICKKCSVKSQQPDLCMDHQTQMANEECSHFKLKKASWSHLGSNTAIYSGASILGVTVGMVAAPFVGLPVIAHAAMLKIGAGFFGGCISIVENKEKDKTKEASAKQDLT